MTNKGLLHRLQYVENDLANKIMDEQEKAEKAGNFTSGMAADGEGICVPEDAAPDLDSARTHIQEAIEDVERHLKGAAA